MPPSPTTYGHSPRGDNHDEPHRYIAHTERKEQGAWEGGGSCLMVWCVIQAYEVLLSLGVVLDTRAHTAAITAYAHTRQADKVRPRLSQNDLEDMDLGVSETGASSPTRVS